MKLEKYQIYDRDNNIIEANDVIAVKTKNGIVKISPTKIHEGVVFYMDKKGTLKKFKPTKSQIKLHEAKAQFNQQRKFGELYSNILLEDKKIEASKKTKTQPKRLTESVDTHRQVSKAAIFSNIKCIIEENIRFDKEMDEKGIDREYINEASLNFIAREINKLF